MNEITKTLLIASFVPKTNIDWFIKYLDNKFLIKKEKTKNRKIDINILDNLISKFIIKEEKVVDLEINKN